MNLGVIKTVLEAAAKSGKLQQLGLQIAKVSKPLGAAVAKGVQPGMQAIGDLVRKYPMVASSVAWVAADFAADQLGLVLSEKDMQPLLESVRTGNYSETVRVAMENVVPEIVKKFENRAGDGDPSALWGRPAAEMTATIKELQLAHQLVKTLVDAFGSVERAEAVFYALNTLEAEHFNTYRAMKPMLR